MPADVDIPSGSDIHTHYMYVFIVWLNAAARFCNAVRIGDLVLQNAQGSWAYLCQHLAGGAYVTFTIDL